MGKLKNIFSSALSSMRNARHGVMNFDLMWRIVLGCTICAIIAIAIVSYLAYDWAAHTETVTVKRDRESSFSADELRNVVLSYQEKEERYKELQQNKSQAPILKGEMPASTSL